MPCASVITRNAATSPHPAETEAVVKPEELIARNGALTTMLPSRARPRSRAGNAWRAGTASSCQLPRVDAFGCCGNRVPREWTVGGLPRGGCERGAEAGVLQHGDQRCG